MAIGRPISLTPNIATKAINSVATANQTDFTVTGGYRINELAVYRNGVRLAQGRDFTANDGTTVTLTNGATLYDVIEFVIFDAFNVANTIVSAASSQTLSGDLNVTGKLYGGTVDTDSLNIGVGTFVSAVHVGTALTTNAAGDIQTVGIITAASFSGDGSALVGLANTDFVVSVATTTGNLNVSAAATITGALTGSTGTFSGAVSGTTGTFSAAVSGTTGTFSGAVNVDATTDSTSSSTGALIVDGGLGVAKNVYIGAGLSVAGTLTYEDVTNVDSVGLITAKSGVNVSGGQVTIGTGITMGIAGVATFSGTSDVHLLDNVKLNVGDGSDLQIYHDGSNDHILSSGTGSLLIKSDAVNLGSASGEYYVRAFENADVQIRYNNSTKIQTTNTGAIVTGICTATSFSGSGEGLTRTTQLSHRNVVINGDFKIAQRGTSHGSSGYRTVDRFQMTAGGASHALTQAQVDVASGTTPYTEGFRKAYSITNAGQNANNQAYAYMQYRVEAQDLATSGWNYTSSSSFITISFWIKASVTQTYLFFFHTNDGGTKEYNHLMSLSANTWTKITLNVPGNSGLQFDNDNGMGLSIYWTAYLGDHYTSTGSVDQWVTHSGYTSRPDMGAGWWTTSNATFQLTGVQLEVGEQATPFEHRSFGEELARCRRYFFALNNSASVYYWFHPLSNNTNYRRCNITFPTTMRTVPTASELTGNNNGSSGTPTGTQHADPDHIDIHWDSTGLVELSHGHFSAEL